jgi:prepilin-type N-terminal cleavage/methylation domain-containing protein
MSGTPVRSAESRTAARPRRDGFTLVELLVTLVMLSLVMGTVMSVLARQQRFYSGVGSVIQTRGQVRQALGLLPGELRALSPSEGDIYAMTDSSIEFRGITGSSIACSKFSTTVVLPPLSLAKGNTLTSWLTKPVPGDSILLLSDSTSTRLSDDGWRAHRITAVSEVTGWSGCTAWSKYVTAADESKPSYKLTLSTSVSSTVKTGAPVRFFRRVHYSLYKTSNGQWFLGYYDCLPTATPNCSAIQPVSGPYRPYAPASSGTSGLTFAYYDSTGAPTSNRLAVARIDIIARGESKRPLWSSQLFSDSLAISIGVRNRT